MNTPIAQNSTALAYYREKHDIEWAMWEEEQQFKTRLAALSENERNRALFEIQREARINAVVWSRTAQYMNKRYPRLRKLLSDIRLRRMAGYATKNEYQLQLKLDRLWDAKRDALQQQIRRKIEKRSAKAQSKMGAVVATEVKNVTTKTSAA